MNSHNQKHREEDIEIWTPYFDDGEYSKSNLYTWESDPHTDFYKSEKELLEVGINYYDNQIKDLQAFKKKFEKRLKEITL